VDEWRSRKVNALLAMVGNLVQKNGHMPFLLQDGTPAEAHPELSIQAAA